MRRQSALWGVFVSRFEDALDRFRRRRLSAEEAGELLGVSGRHFRRLCVRFEENGLEDLRDRRLGQPSPRRADPAELGRMCGLYRDRYRDFTAKHFHETLVREHGYRLGYTVRGLRCRRQAWCRRRGCAASTARSASAVRCRAC